MPSPLYDRNYLLLNGSNFLYSLYATQFIFLPAFLYRLGTREGEIGLLMATGALVSVSLKPVNGVLVDRGGRIPFLITGALLAAASTIPWIFVRGKGGHLFAIRIFQGMAYSFFATAAYAYIAAVAPEDRRGEALGIFGLSFFVPWAAGGWLGEQLIGAYGFRALFVCSAGIAVAAGLLPLWISDPPRSAGLSFSSLREFLTRPYFVPNTASFLFGMGHGTLFTFLPVYLLLTRVSGIGLFLLVYALSVIGTRTIGRTLTDRFPRPRLVLLALLLIGAGVGSVPFARGHGGIVLVAAVSGTGHGILFPSLSALVLDRSGRDRGGIAMAMFTGALDMGLVTGAAAFGFVAEHLGYRAMFGSAAALTGAGSLLFFLLDPSFRRAAPPPPAP